MIKLSNEQIAVLGRPNFKCARVAQVLIAAGIYEDNKKSAEYEQAVFIHWALGLLEKHGENWQDEGNKILSGCLANAG